MIVTMTKGSVIVTIDGVEFAENFDKSVATKFSYPVTHPWAEDPKYYVIDLLNIEHMCTISGELDASSSNQNRTYAHEVVNDVIEMMEGGGTLTVTAKNSTGTVTIFTETMILLKFQFKYIATDEDIPSLVSTIISLLECNDLTEE